MFPHFPKWRWLLLALLPLTVAGQGTPALPAVPAESLGLRLDVIGGTTIRNSLRTHADDLPLSGTVYRTTLGGKRYFFFGLAPTIWLNNRDVVVTLELPIAYETTHAYAARRPFAGPVGLTWPDSISAFSAAALRADYLSVRGGIRVAALPGRRVRPFVGVQLGYSWVLRLRENYFQQDNPYGKPIEHKFFGRSDQATELDYTTFAALAGIEVGAATGRILTLGVRAESGIRFMLFDSVEPVWHSVAITAGYSVLSWSRR